MSSIVYLVNADNYVFENIVMLATHCERAHGMLEVQIHPMFVNVLSVSAYCHDWGYLA